MCFVQCRSHLNSQESHQCIYLNHQFHNRVLQEFYVIKKTFKLYLSQCHRRKISLLLVFVIKRILGYKHQKKKDFYYLVYYPCIYKSFVLNFGESRMVLLVVERGLVFILATVALLLAIVSFRGLVNLQEIYLNKYFSQQI